MPTVTALSASSNFCSTNAIELIETGTGGSSWGWQGPNGFVSSNRNITIPNSTIQNTGLYTVSVTSSNGCTNVDSLWINVFPTYSTFDSATICEGGMPYTFCNSQYDEAGTYTCNLTTIQGCDSTITLILKEEAIFNFIAVPDTAFWAENQTEIIIPILLNDSLPSLSQISTIITTEPQNGSATLESLFSIKYVKNSNFFGIDTFFYKVCSSVCDDFCDSTMVLIVNVNNPLSSDIKKCISDVVTPLGSPGQNDTFDPMSAIDKLFLNAKNVRLSIYTKTGELVYFDKSERPIWEALNKNGKSYPEATYYYQFQFEIDESAISIFGALTVLTGQ